MTGGLGEVPVPGLVGVANNSTPTSTHGVWVGGGGEGRTGDASAPPVSVGGGGGGGGPWRHQNLRPGVSVGAPQSTSVRGSLGLTLAPAKRSPARRVSARN